MKMKKAALATRYKFNIRKNVAKSVTYRFSLGVVKGIVKNALENSGVKNPDEIIKRFEAEIVELQERINKTDAKFENYKKETDKTIVELKDEIRVSKQTALQIGRDIAMGFYEQSQKICPSNERKNNKTFGFKRNEWIIINLNSGKHGLAGFHYQIDFF